MGSRTDEEIKRDYIAKMGLKLGTQFYELWRETVSLHWKWVEYRQLYGTNESRIELLNRAAPQFFRMVQDVLWEDIVLHVARLMDKRKGTLGIQKLPNLVKGEAAKKDVQNLVNEAGSKSKFCKDWRNRHIAHRNLALATNPQSVEPLETASREKMAEALDSIAAVLNAVSAHFRDSETSFHHIVITHGAEELLCVLDSGVRAELARRERLTNGKAVREDWEAREL